jgi:hypothetical protein
MHTSTVVHTICCQECRRSWLDGRERWRIYLADEKPVELVPYCPGCARREFDGELVWPLTPQQD